MRLNILIGLAALLAAAAVVAGGLVLTAPDAPPAAPTRWHYSAVQVFNAPGGLVVRCQSKTNSLDFANRVKARRGDVLIQTCRAGRAPEAS